MLAGKDCAGKASEETVNITVICGLSSPPPTHPPPHQTVYLPPCLCNLLHWTTHQEQPPIAILLLALCNTVRVSFSYETAAAASRPTTPDKQQEILIYA